MTQLTTSQNLKPMQVQISALRSYQHTSRQVTERKRKIQRKQKGEKEGGQREKEGDRDIEKRGQRKREGRKS